MNRLGAVRAHRENAEQHPPRPETARGGVPRGRGDRLKLFGERATASQRFGRGGFIKLALRTGDAVVPRRGGRTPRRQTSLLPGTSRGTFRRAVRAGRRATRTSGPLGLGARTYEVGDPFRRTDGLRRAHGRTPATRPGSSWASSPGASAPRSRGHARSRRRAPKSVFFWDHDRGPKPPPADGVVVIPTSRRARQTRDVVMRVRSPLKTRAVGHAGDTLDPISPRALLVVAVGEAQAPCRGSRRRTDLRRRPSPRRRDRHARRRGQRHGDPRFPR